MTVIHTFNKCFPIWSTDVTSGDVIAAHTYFCWYVVTDHDDCIHWNLTCQQAFSSCFYICNFVTRWFRIIICSHRVKTIETTGWLVVKDIYDQKYTVCSS